MDKQTYKQLKSDIFALIEKTVAESDDVDLICDLIDTSLRLSENHVTRKDVSITSAALKEMRYAFKFFAPYKQFRKVSIFGSARTLPSEAIYQHATAFSKAIAHQGFMVITGAGEGIMRAAQEGAGKNNSFGINIVLPFEQSANKFIQDDPKLMTFKYFFTRKLFFVRQADAVTLFPGGFGTHDEGYEAMTLVQTGKTDPMPLVFVDTPGGTYWSSWLSYIQDELVERGLISPEDLHFIKVTDNVDEAVDEITTFYRNYHSSCFIREQVFLRSKYLLKLEDIEALNDHFSDIVAKGKITRSEAHPDEDPCPEQDQLHRIAFQFDQRSFGRIRQMIDMINTFK